jgi:hypothetical protein
MALVMNNYCHAISMERKAGVYVKEGSVRSLHASRLAEEP